MKRTKIAVIGGGLGSMSAVYHIMQLPNAKELYEITIYQTGWRLGGKGASGVNQQRGYRVEEHGIHFWFGFYENGFKMMRKVYGSLGRPPEAPLATFEEAFAKQSEMDFKQLIGDKWVDWPIKFPPPFFPGKVGEGDCPTVDKLLEIFITWLADKILEFIDEIIHYIWSHLDDYQYKLPRGLDFELVRPRFSEPLETQILRIERNVEKIPMYPVERHLRVISQWLRENHTLRTPDDTDSLSDILYFLQQILQLIAPIPLYLIEECAILVQLLGTVDFATAVLAGMIKDRVIQFHSSGEPWITIDVSQINRFDFTEWLILNGANDQLIINNPAVKSMYDGPFAFFRGAVFAPNVEAGTALNIFLRLAFTCKENIMWRMQAGMGDTIFGPIYQLFQKEFPENVHFEFFSRVKNLQLNEVFESIEPILGEQSVVSITIEKQVRLAKDRTQYDPLILVKGLPCWPSEPLYEQLDLTHDQINHLRYLQDNSIGLESDWTPWSGEWETKTHGEDFDTVLIGASLSSLPLFCPELITANPKWATMLDQVGTVQTQAFQLWFNKKPCELKVDSQKVISCYVEPLDTFAVMDQVLEREDWSGFPIEKKPKCLVYVCGAMMDSQNIPPTSLSYFPDSQRKKVHNSAKEYIITYLQDLMPGAFYEDGTFNWDLLVAPNDCVGSERLDYQYCRANIDSSERYVYALQDTSKYRLAADESGFKNVFLTGDWIRNGMNIGFVEGAVISGIQAARAITGQCIPICVPW